MSSSRLPRGRHQLTVEQVAADQRRRILAALAEVLAAKGFAAASVADIIAAAGVSRQTFYEQFDSKQACFLAGFEEQRQRLIAATAAGLPTRGTPVERFAGVLAGYLAAIAGHPDLARLYLIEVYAAGPEVLAQRALSQQEFAGGLARALRVRSRQDRFACEVLINAISSMVTMRLAVGDVEGIRLLQRPLVALATRLFSGGSRPLSAVS